MINRDPQKIEEAAARGVQIVYPSPEELKKRLLAGKKLRIYCGYDPSSPHLHLGHLISLKKLAQFQALGHEVIFLIGDFTGMIGDPTDKQAARKKMSRKEVLANARNYKKMAGKILNFGGKNPAKILFNSKWQDGLVFRDLVELSSFFTVQQMMARDMFQERVKEKKPIYLHEFLYPLAQAYDSVAMNVDLEVGGNDQFFNMLCGRDLMKNLKKKDKLVVGLRLLEGAEGKKMGKSEGNAVNIDEKPEEMYGKIMNWPDEMIVPALELCTDVPMEEIKKIEEEMRAGKVNPRDAKVMLSKEIVRICHSKEKAAAAQKEFERIFKKEELPAKIPQLVVEEKEINIMELLVKARLVSSKSEAKRMILQRGVKIDGETKNDWREEIEIKKGLLVQVGKRKIARVRKP